MNTKFQPTLVSLLEILVYCSSLCFFIPTVALQTYPEARLQSWQLSLASHPDHNCSTERDKRENLLEHESRRWVQRHT